MDNKRKGRHSITRKDIQDTFQGEFKIVHQKGYSPKELFVLDKPIDHPKYQGGGDFTQIIETKVGWAIGSLDYGFLYIYEINPSEVQINAENIYSYDIKENKWTDTGIFWQDFEKNQQ